MKIAIVTMTRTRSSYLLDVLCKAYGIPNLYEYYKPGPDEYAKKFIRKDLNQTWNKYKTLQKDLTDTLFEKNESFGVKIFPFSYFNFFKIVPGFYKSTQSSFNFDSQDFLDFYSYFRLEQYDKIFLLTRETIVDTIVSQYYALQSKKFLVKKEEKGLIKHLQPKGKLFLSNSDEFFINARVLSCIVLKHLPIYLNKKSLPFVSLDYKEVPRYLNANYIDTESDLVDTEFDYQTCVSNYKEIEDKVKICYDNLLKKNDWESLFL